MVLQEGALSLPGRELLGGAGQLRLQPRELPRLETNDKGE